MDTAIYTLTSSLHDEAAVDETTREFLGSIGVKYDFKGGNFDDYGTLPLNLIFVRTGGAEGIFNELLPTLSSKSNRPFYLLTSGKSNSLAASMEILSFLRQNGIQGEIIHGVPDYIKRRIDLLRQVEIAHKALNGCRLGIIGKPSDWLIASHADQVAVKEKLGIDLIEISMDELLDEYNKLSDEPNDMLMQKAPTAAIKAAIPGAMRIYHALKQLAERHNLNGFTLRCFDMLTSVRNTGCLALAKFNSDGIIASCEGDVPAMLSMAIAQALTGVTGFQANPARINPETGEMLFAHCTIPFNMVSSYELDTHFESGIGVGIRGYMSEGDVTIFKASGKLDRCFAAEGKLIRNQAEPNLCRTQQVIQLDDPKQAAYFLTNPIGNHHIIVPGHHKQLFEALLA